MKHITFMLVSKETIWKGYIFNISPHPLSCLPWRIQETYLYQYFNNTIFHSAIVNKMRAKRCFPAADCYNGDVLLFQGNFAFCRCIWHIKWNMDWFNGSDDRRMGVVRWNCRGLFLGTESTERRRWTLCTNCSKSKLALLRLYLHKQLPCIMRI